MGYGDGIACIEFNSIGCVPSRCSVRMPDPHWLQNLVCSVSLKPQLLQNMMASPLTDQLHNIEWYNSTTSKHFLPANKYKKPIVNLILDA